MSRKFVNGQWISESFGNKLFDTITLMQFMQEQTDLNFVKCAMKVCRQNLEPVLEALNDREQWEAVQHEEVELRARIKRMADLGQSVDEIEDLTGQAPEYIARCIGR